MDNVRQEASISASRADGPLRHGFCLLAAAESGLWPDWTGPAQPLSLRRRVETLALLFDIIPRAEMAGLDEVLADWAIRFPKSEHVPPEQLRYAARAVLTLAEASMASAPPAADPRADSAVSASDTGVVEAARELQAALSVWKRSVQNDRRWTHLPAFVPGEPAARIDEVYVELHAVSEHDVSEDLNADSERATRVSRRLLADRQPVVGVPTMVARTLERCVVVGEPGSGKSTLVQWLAHITYKGAVPDYDHALVVKLSAYAMAFEESPGLTLLEFFFNCLKLGAGDWPRSRSLLRRRAAEERRHLLVLDGWDEVPLPLRERVREQILSESRDFVTIITSRPSGLPRELRENGRVEFYRIAGLTPRATEELAGKLLRRLERVDLLDPILGQLREEPDLREMAANPFLLGLLVRVLARTLRQASSDALTPPRAKHLVHVTARATGRPVPDSLADIYRQITTWMQEEHNRLVTSADALTADHIAILGRLAHGLLYGTELPRYLFRGRELAARLADRGVSAEPIQRSRFTNTTEFDEHCFLHATLQEYFAATYAATLPPDELDDLLDRSFWSATRLVVLEFVAGIGEAGQQCRRKAKVWFQSRDRFHHALLRLARVAAAGRWRADDPDGIGRAIRDELWRIIENKEYPVTTTAAVQAFAELDPAELVSRVSSAKTLDFLLHRSILDSVPSSLIVPEALEGVIEGPWRPLASLVIVKAKSDREIAAVRGALRNPSLDSEARATAIRIAAMSRDAGAVPDLIEMLRPGFPDHESQKEAIDGLGQIGGRASVEALTDVLVDVGRPEELAGHASAALSLQGSAALDPAGRDRLLRYIAASDPVSKRLGDVFYALMDYPIRTGTEVVEEVATCLELPAKLRVAAIRVVASATDRDVVQRVASSVTLERDGAVVQALCRLAMDRSANLSPEWLEERIEGEPNDAQRTLYLAVYLLQLARSSGARRALGQAFVHRLATAALVRGAPDDDGHASSMTRALTQPEPTQEPLLDRETLELACRALDAFIASRAEYNVDQLLLAVNVVRHFPSESAGKLLRQVMDKALYSGQHSKYEQMRQEWERLAGFVTALLAAIAPGELLDRPTGCDLVDNALREVSVRRGWLVFSDRITDAEGRVIARTKRARTVNVKSSESTPVPMLGIITALPIETAAVRAVFGDPRRIDVPGAGAGRAYWMAHVLSPLGGTHCIVIAEADMGNNIAAIRASLLLSHFPNVTSIIMCGIAGGVPAPDKAEDHVRLGDIVVSNQKGVVQYDFVKRTVKRKRADVAEEIRAAPRPPSALLLEAVRILESNALLGQRPWEGFLQECLDRLQWRRPDESTDVLADLHEGTQGLAHPTQDARRSGQPLVFRGPIASANTLLKDPARRDGLREKFGVKAVEMEGSGIADATWTHGIGYLVVRGISDYCDMKKNDRWQPYAAAGAAAYVRALLEVMPGNTATPSDLPNQSGPVAHGPLPQKHKQDNMRATITSAEPVGTIRIRTADDRQREFDCARFMANNRHAKDFSRDSENARYDFRVRLEQTVRRLVEYDRLDDAQRLVLDFDFLAARIALEPSLTGLTDDLNQLEARLSPADAVDVRTIRRALQISASIVSVARDQLPEQMLARLGSAASDGRIERLRYRARLYKAGSWLRPLRASLESPDSPLEEILEFQEDLIAAANFDPYSGRLWTVGDRQLVGWDLTNRKASVTFRFDDASPTAVASNGVFVAVTTREGPVMVFDPVTGRRFESLPGHERATLDGTFLRDDLLVTVGTDGFIRIWNVRESRQVARLSEGDRPLHCVLPLGGGCAAVGGDPDGSDRSSIEIWNLETQTRLGLFGSHSWPVDHLALDESLTVLAAGANDELTLWRLADLTCLRRIATPHTKCHALAFVAPRLLVSGDSSGELRVWNIDSGEEVRRLPSHSGLVSALCVAPSGKRFATTSWDQTVHIWNVERVLAPQPLSHNQQVTTLAFFPDESRIVSGSQDNTLIMWDATDGRPLARFEGHGHWVSSVWAGNVIVSASWDGTLCVWDPVTQGRLSTIPTGDKHVSVMTCTSDGSKIATVSPDGMVRVWNMTDGTQLAVTASPETEIRSIAFVDRGRRLRWGTQRRQVFDWFMDGREARVMEIAGTAPATTWDLDVRSGVSVRGSANGGILLFDPEGRPRAEFGIPGCGPSAIIRSADGELLLAAGGLPQMASDNTARLWRTSAVESPVASFLADTPFTAAALSRDGRHVVLGDVSGAVHFLECVNV
jgi:WD40 repeat protein/nucleoside phosphorylase/energy-coupling factor transporter ATP-binding protein EcfA2